MCVCVCVSDVGVCVLCVYRVYCLLYRVRL